MRNVNATILPPTTPPPGNGTFDCNYEGQINANFTEFRVGVLSRYEGIFEVCIGGILGSVCDIGWNEAAARAICRDRFGSDYGMFFFGLLHAHEFHVQ